MLAGVATIAFMFLVVRPVVVSIARRSGRLARRRLAGCLSGVVAFALTTEGIGIHAIFGAFLLGAIIPHDSVARL